MKVIEVILEVSPAKKVQVPRKKGKFHSSKEL